MQISSYDLHASNIPARHTMALLSLALDLLTVVLYLFSSCSWILQMQFPACIILHSVTSPSHVLSALLYLGSSPLILPGNFKTQSVNIPRKLSPHITQHTHLPTNPPNTLCFLTFHSSYKRQNTVLLLFLYPYLLTPSTCPGVDVFIYSIKPVKIYTRR